MRTFLMLAALLLAPGASGAQESAIGRWKTIDEATGMPKPVVEIRQGHDGRLGGKVVEILDLKGGPDPACRECRGASKGKPIKGLTIILRDLKPAGPGKWEGGRVPDQENGKDYKARPELPDGGRKLGMSGCIAFLCRQQVWVRQ